MYGCSCCGSLLQHTQPPQHVVQPHLWCGGKIDELKQNMDKEYYASVPQLMILRPVAMRAPAAGTTHALNRTPVRALHCT